MKAFKRLILLLLTTIVNSLTAVAVDTLSAASLPLIPMPTTLSIGEGGAPMAAFTTIAYPAEQYKALAEQFAGFLGKVSGKSLSTILDPNAVGAGIITLRIKEGAQDEAYTLRVAADGSTLVEASTAHGLFNGLTTLRQLFYDARFNNDGRVQSVSISDSPRFEYRGFMLDVARHYFDKAEVKKLLDVMALYKINKFHWHLTDDQGWRIEIPEYPLLTTIGAVRSRSLTKTTNPKFYDDTEYGRGKYYTLADLKEIVDYAAKLHIDILPEVDLPGHMVAAIASYPEEFSCDPSQGIDAENKDKYNVRVELGISKDVLNVAKPEVMTFLKCVLGHVADVFPYPTIHIGGDECPKDAWNLRISSGDKAFLAWMDEHNLSSADDIQPWLVNELGQWLRQEHGKEVVCWNELTKHWKDEFATRPIIMCYNEDGKKYMREAVDKGLRTIYTGCFPFYLDMYQTYNPINADIDNPANHTFDDPYTGGYGNNTLQRIYEATPTSSIAGSEDMCLGVGVNLWTESCNNNREAEHQFFPRALALAEVGWLPQQAKSWTSFRKRVQTHFRIFDEMGVYYATYDKEADNDDANIKEAQRLLKDAQPDVVGYPSAEAYEDLRKALSDYETSALLGGTEGKTALQKAVADFKAAPIMLPTPGKTYRIVSASVAWSCDYAGSTIYPSPDGACFRFHYTPQGTSNELFRFEVAKGGFHLVNCSTEQGISLGKAGSRAVSSKQPSVVRIDAPHVASTSPAYYDYVPGMVLISAQGHAPEGDNSDGVTSLVHLNAHADGYLYAEPDQTVGHTSCWRIVEAQTQMPARQ